MGTKWRIGILALYLVILPVLPVRGEYASWRDAGYDFTKVKAVYLDDMDFSKVKLQSAARREKMGDYWRKKAGKLGKVQAVLAPRAVPRALLPGEKLESEQKKTEKTVLPAAKEDGAVRIPEEAAQGTDLYVTAGLDALDGDAYLVPAHTEWRTTEVDDGYYDRDGHYHSWYRTITYPEYIPAHYVPYVTVGAEFRAYDTKTGKLVLSSEDLRTRGNETSPVDMYKRIVDRFFKNFRDALQEKGRMEQQEPDTAKKQGAEGHESKT